DITLELFGRRFWSIGQVCDAARTYFSPASLQIGPETIVDPPRQVLDYPLAIGKMWTVLTDAGFMIKKEVTDSVEVVTPAGAFGAYEITWRYYILITTAKPNSTLGPGPGGQGGTGSDDPDIVFFYPNLVVTDYIAPIGLVKRTISAIGLTATDYSSDPLGTFDIYEEWLLESYRPPSTDL
ncbi:MAG: hypothetical protein KKA81_17035, partial [Bacteroidetes bacterium]|nr:hypothetical protein [Bacteroidota bacterium]